MLLIDNTQRRPSDVTGLSLVLFLFLSLLSMMAAYEAGKPVDELRNNVVASFHEYSTQIPDPESNAAFCSFLSEAARGRAFWRSPDCLQKTKDRCEPAAGARDRVRKGMQWNKVCSKRP